MNSRAMRIACLIVLILITQSVDAVEITVRKDGSGNFGTIDDAVAAASSNDTIVVGPGTYVEPFIDVLIPLHIRSESGPDVTILDGSSSNRIFRFLEITGVVGFTFLDGQAVTYTGVGGALVARQGAIVLIENCKFHNNTGTYGGALYVTHEGTEVTVTNCSFTNNYASTIGGAISVMLGAICNVNNCVFENNSVAVWGGAINAGEGSTLNVSQSLFASNVSGDVAGAIYMYKAMGTIQTSTFKYNKSPGGWSGTLTIQNSAAAIITRNIIAYDTAGYGLMFPFESDAIHSCNLFWDNYRGSRHGGEPGFGEMVTDPLFCSAPADTFALGDNSPALASNNLCELLIGAYDIGCGPVGVSSSSWGKIKSLHKP